ncbi:ABC transporter permease [Epidermidibacterium keratini]|uniref:ABC transporter permease n=1 Tax=Epidermidibacterium keratini TaxID=1891644 RepID=A0A7L4YM71_9ACTN|nr:ABC transporter permease [Epidermidibacterium keratini]QHC00266.1 ABC transporter permease [Epidermidibacterium keratini]
MSAPTTERSAATSHSPGGGELTRTGLLARFVVRRDRIRLLIWIAVLVMLPVATASAYESLYPTPAERAGLDAQFGATKALGMVTGPAENLGTAGGFVAWRLSATLAAIIGLMAIFHVVRHTRTEEETGHAELTYPTAIGRYAPLASAVLTSAIASLVIGILIATTLIGPTGDTAGSIAFGLTTAAAGIFFACLAALTAQLAASTRAALGLACAVLGVSFILRGISDSSDIAWPKWLSPIGWAQLVEPYGDRRWWVIALQIVAALALLGAAVAMRNRRDVGSGRIEPSPGPADAGPRLRSMWALAARLHRPSLIGWGVGVLIAGLLFGSLVNAVSNIAGTSPEIVVILEQLGGAKGITAAFIGMTTQLVAMIVGLYVVSTILTLRTDETSGRAELLLGTPATRMSWFASHLGFAVAGSLILLLIFGGGLTLSSLIAGTELSGGVVLGSALVQLPAVLILAGVVAVVVGWIPSASGLGWAAGGLALAIGLFGPVLDLPTAVLRLSPYYSVPKVTESGTDWAPIVIQLAIAAALLVIAAVGMRRRNIPT